MSPTPVHLRAAGVSLVLDVTGPVPSVLHWGADLGELDTADLDALRATDVLEVPHNQPDDPRRLTLLPTEHDMWSGTPGFAGHLAGTRTTPRPELRAAVRVTGRTVAADLVDPVTGLEIDLVVALSPEGLVQVSHTVRRPAGDADPEQPFDVAGVLAVLPLPARATEILDFTGRWARERQPQRLPVVDGAHRRDVRRGKPGPDSPHLAMVGTPAFGSRTGEVWGLHVAWSGDTSWLVERLPEPAGTHRSVLGGGELLRAGEVRLLPGQEYRTPTAYFAWSDRGTDGIADRFHQHLRARSGHPARPRPVIVNTWEAVYFDHRLEPLLQLVDRAAEIGVERFVLDDGWFLGRRDDTAGLGDWSVDRTVWTEGLGPLADHVRARGLEFGLWVEPEMVNLDSELARTHPEWLLAPAPGVGPASRNQYVVNVAHPEAFEYLLTSISALVSEYDIAYLKWDHNRELHEAVSRVDGRPGVSAQTHAVYALFDRLRDRHPGLEIESCSSGGARVDLGILERTDRVWASDCIDPVERVMIDRWTMQLLPPELVGAHVGAPRSHTTARVTDLPFRLATALIGHVGVEWNLNERSPEELAILRSWIGYHKSIRPLIASGTVVHGDLADPQTTLAGVVSPERDQAVFVWTRTGTSATTQAGRVPLPGLAEDRTYSVRVVSELGEPEFTARVAPAWTTAPLTISGSVLGAVGLPMPTLAPQQAMVLEVRAV
ncbi:alpha-galactosidase [Cryptosporangium aurantiacum]|uniref:alpha-galactosidase n=1 Tax=Cryptosporangium aurantiacum TaxID=134849 RepID=A0A1M7RND8_9ACTN|nr:alpha-galactosidase [Cryptosporangium aurantiacum]SHN47721.1 alpha-galactosidase [Cryptosporangium aurantiacum]